MDLRQLFETLSYEDIQAYVEAGQEEHLHLDFKTVKGPSLRSDDDKRNFAKALSGSANSSGGIIVWGVDARKGADGIDRAREIQPVDPVAQLVSRLNELTGAYVEPIVDGVQHRGLTAGDGTAGVALTFVPESEGGPHMAKGGEDRFYKRSGDSFYRMEHFDIADMFGRRRRPDLHLVATVRSDGSISSGGTTRYLAKVLLSIANQGRGSARSPYLSFRLSEPYKVDRYGIDGNGNEGLPRVSVAGDGRFYAYGANAAAVIHPDTQQEVCAIRAEVYQHGGSPPDLEISYSLTAEDIRLIRRVLTIPGADIAAAVRPGSA